MAFGASTLTVRVTAWPMVVPFGETGVSVRVFPAAAVRRNRRSVALGSLKRRSLLPARIGKVPRTTEPIFAWTVPWLPDSTIKRSLVSTLESLRISGPKRKSVGATSADVT